MLGVGIRLLQFLLEYPLGTSEEEIVTSLPLDGIR